MDIELTEEEIVKEASKDSSYCQLSVDIGLWASKAQLKKVVKWGQACCSHDVGGYSSKQWHCPICREELKRISGLRRNPE